MICISLTFAVVNLGQKKYCISLPCNFQISQKIVNNKHNQNNVTYVCENQSLCAQELE